MNRGLTLLLGLALLSGCQTPTDRFEAVDRYIADLTKAMVPDKRLEVVEVAKAVDARGNLIIKGLTTLPAFRDQLMAGLDSLGFTEEVTDSILVLPDPALGEQTWALVNVAVCNIRTRPGHSQELTTQALLGTPLRLLQEQDGWFRVQTPEAYIAWVDEAAIQRMSADAMTQWRQSTRLVFKKDFALLYASPTAGAVVSDLAMGAILQKTDASGKDTEVMLPDGRKGWIDSNFLMDWESYTSQTFPDTTGLFALAHTFTGRPYLWGGTSPRGVDCSGYMKSLFLMQGIILSRDANQQVKHGDEVALDDDLSNLQAGDLLFYGRKATEDRSERVSHGGLYLGNGKYIHACGRVKVNSFRSDDPDFSQYLRDILLHARRIESADTDRGPWSVRNHQWYQP